MFDKKKIEISMQKARHVKEIQFRLSSPVSSHGPAHLCLEVMSDSTSSTFSNEEIASLIEGLNEAITPLKNSWIKRLIAEIHDEMTRVETEFCPCSLSPES